MFLILSCNCLCPIHWSQVLRREWRCSWSSTNRRCSNYICVNKLIAWGVTYIRGLTVVVMTHWGLMMHIYFVSELGHHKFGQQLCVCLAPSYYQNHCWLKPRLHYTRCDPTRRDAIWRDIQVLFALCATLSRAVTWQQGIWDPEQIN